MKTIKYLSLAAAASATMASANTLAFQAGDIIVRAGFTTVAPEENSDQVALNGSVAALNGVLGSASELGVDSDTQLGLTPLFTRCLSVTSFKED